MILRDTVRLRAVTAICVALPLGLGLGVVWHDIAQRLDRGLALGVDVGIEFICQVLLAWFAVIILRTAETRKVWMAAGILAAPVVAVHYAPAYHPLLLLICEAAWFLTIVACAREKRTWGLWTIVVCAACITSIKISSRMTPVPTEHRAH